MSCKSLLKLVLLVFLGIQISCGKHNINNQYQNKYFPYLFEFMKTDYNNVKSVEIYSFGRDTTRVLEKEIIFYNTKKEIIRIEKKKNRKRDTSFIIMYFNTLEKIDSSHSINTRDNLTNTTSTKNLYYDSLLVETKKWKNGVLESTLRIERKNKFQSITTFNSNKINWMRDKGYNPKTKTEIIIHTSNGEKNYQIETINEIINNKSVVVNLKKIDSKGKILEITSSKRDENNFLWIYNEDFKEEENNHTVYDPLGRVIEISEISEWQGDIKYLFKYFENSTKISKKIFYKNDSLTQINSYYYDVSGNLIDEKNSLSNNPNWHDYKYLYDSNNNLSQFLEYYYIDGKKQLRQITKYIRVYNDQKDPIRFIKIKRNRINELKKYRINYWSSR